MSRVIESKKKCTSCNFSKYFTDFFEHFNFIEDLRNYSIKKFKVDIVAGLTVAMVVIPQSMAYAAIADVPAKYGLYAAIIPTIIASLFGSSRFLIAGPTNAISMVVAGTMGSALIAGQAASHLPDNEKILFVFLLAFLVGIIQIFMGFAKLGTLIKFVSHSVIIGFTAGAGVLIAFNQIKNLIGVEIGSHAHFYGKMYHTFMELPHTNIRALFLGIFTVAFIILAKRFAPKLPGPLFAMIFSAIFVLIFDLKADGVKTVAEIPQSFPPLSIDFLSKWEYASTFFASAIAIAILGIVEALSIAKSIAGSSGEKIDGNKELVGQGLSNVSSAFFSSIPGSGSFTRSAVNYKSGAKSRFAGVYSGLFVLVIVLIFAKLTVYIPQASLAGILMVISYSMIDQRALKLAWKSTKTDRLVLVVTIISTLVIHLDQAVYVGVALSLVLFLRKAAKPSVIEVSPDIKTNRFQPVEKHKNICPQLAIFQVEGSLFFGAVEDLEEKLHSSKLLKKKVIIVRMKGIHVIDATGIYSLEKLLRVIEATGNKLIFSGVSKEVYKVFENSGIINKIGRKNILINSEKAIKLAMEYVDQDECRKCKIKIFRECR